ncbi:uncharacterized protein LOC118097204 isoform X3 [Zootoca vivipara]|uniref:uncharacterized protein LOC118097204 isoform X3 n=1 Tax=Zootoca vivipara TaxID=8524 RepID=UPI00293BA172|nr:uncharacterized protein LOC118097204 isoform X3 [Zootoca vivipara]XP_060139011.1 uncharacterized protein LOC118097204 isoform X3 [Zootoca vivipara]
MGYCCSRQERPMCSPRSWGQRGWARRWAAASRSIFLRLCRILTLYLHNLDRKVKHLAQQWQHIICRARMRCTGGPDACHRRNCRDVLPPLCSDCCRLSNNSPRSNPPQDPAHPGRQIESAVQVKQPPEINPAPESSPPKEIDCRGRDRENL